MKPKPLRWFTPDRFDMADAPAATQDPQKEGVLSAAGTLPRAPKNEAGIALPGALLATGLQHPLANRTARLEGVVVGYQLKRVQRRSIGFSIGPDGLVVTAPGWVPIAQIDTALAGKAGWVVRKLAEVRERADRAEAMRIVWRDRASLPFLGRTLTLRLDPVLGACGAARLGGEHGFAAALGPGAENLMLRIALPRDASPLRIESAVQAFLRDEARRLFEQRLAHFAPRLGVRWQRLSLCDAATRWGSASTNGSIRLHWRLIQMEPALIDYVVVHELAHLRVMDHSPRFWAVVASVLPDHGALRRQLKDLTLPPWE